MRFAQKLSTFGASATLAVNAKTLELKAQGMDVISLAVGEPDFPTPPHIQEAARQAITDNFSKYTPVEGIPELRRAVATYFHRVYGVDAKMENTIICNGGKQSLFQVMTALLDPGDEVIIPTPYWTSYPDMVYLAGAIPVFVPSPASEGFRISPKDLDSALSPRSKMLLLNSPSNPTGVTYTQSELDALLEWAKANHVFVISDEIYDQLVYPPAKAASASIWWQKNQEHVAITNGLSKAFAMTGWRIGYTLAHPDLIKEMGKIQGQTTSNICSIAQKAALEALNSPYTCVDEMRKAFQKRRDYAHAKISSWKGIICPKPEGAFYLFPDVSALFTPEIPDASTMCTHILEKAQVALMPGEAFGNKNCLRFSYAVADDVLAKALDAVEKALFG